MAQFEFILSGFGGQGILSMGMIMAHAGMIEGKNVSWLPSYGPEMRGGTANCNVIISDSPVGSPIVNVADGIVCMNGPSFDKFESFLKPGGIAVADGSLVERTPVRTDITYAALPATEMADKAGNKAYAGIALLGKLISATHAVTAEAFEEALRHVLPERRHYMIPDEMEMLKKGMTY